MAKKAVVFDLYRTLISMPDTRWLPRLLDDFDFTSEEDRKRARDSAFTRNFSSLSEFAAYVGGILPEHFSIYEEDISKELKEAKLYPDVVGVLKKLKKQGILLGAISNATSQYKIPFFNLRLDKYADKYIFSCDAGIKKPDREIYLRMASMLGVPASDILMTGDKIYADVDGPKEAGMSAILLDRKNKHFECKEKISTLEGIFKYL